MSEKIWYRNTLYYQIGNFLSTVAILGGINAQYGSIAAATISVAELYTGVIGAAILRYALMTEGQCNHRVLMRRIGVLRLMALIVGAIVFVFAKLESTLLLTCLASLCAVCLTPAYELLKTNYNRYGILVVVGRVVSLALIMLKPPFSVAWIPLYFLPISLAGMISQFHVRKMMLAIEIPLNDWNEGRQHWISFCIAFVMSMLAALISQRLLSNLALLQGFWITVERVMRASVAFSFPYIFKLTRNKSTLSILALFCLAMVDVFVLVFKIGNFGLFSEIMLVCLPALLAFGVSWVGLNYAGNKRSSMLAIGLLIIGYMAVN